jgi:hypothetical protein
MGQRSSTIMAVHLGGLATRWHQRPENNYSALASIEWKVAQTGKAALAANAGVA